jgi:Tetracyclin repressor-like, C-terminal domain
MQQSTDSIDSVIVAFDDPIEAIATAFATFDRILTSDSVLGWFIVNVSVSKPSLGLTMQKSFMRDVQHGLDIGAFRLPHAQMAVDVVSLSLLAFFRARLQGKAEPTDISHFILYVMRILGVDDEKSLPVIASVCKRFNLQ